MRKYVLGVMALLLILFMYSGARADTTDKYDDGSWRITSADTLRPVTLTSGNMMVPYNTVTTGSTLTALKSGQKLIVVPSGNGGTINLPGAAVGLEFTFIDGQQNDRAATFSINPKDADRIVYGSPLLSLGDKLTSPGATGDSVTLICGAANKWYIAEMKGTWTDGD